MKNKISGEWKGSKKARKQRKYRFNSPLHVKHKMISSHLSKELRKKYNKRAVPLRKGDTVKIMRGQFKGKEGKIAIINTKKMKVFVEGVQKSRKEGTKVNVLLEPSNLMILSLNLEDKKRVKILERKPMRRTEKAEIKGGEK